MKRNLLLGGERRKDEFYGRWTKSRRGSLQQEDRQKQRGGGEGEMVLDRDYITPVIVSNNRCRRPENWGNKKLPSQVILRDQIGGLTG